MSNMSRLVFDIQEALYAGQPINDIIHYLTIEWQMHPSSAEKMVNDTLDSLERTGAI
tara:strand:+ start:182 stop:352 length:171 start_codon:yes stop_codon:yes gene_type:complete